MNNIALSAQNAIEMLDNRALRNALTKAYTSPQGVRAVIAAQRLFDHLTSEVWNKDTLARFLSSWYAIHGGALSVSGLIVRLHRQASKVHLESKLLLYEATSQICEVIGEDTGVNDTPHYELFNKFANYLIGDDRWQRKNYLIQGCKEFRNKMMNRRLKGELEEAILFTAASELWNTGEYQYFINLVIRPWLSSSSIFLSEIEENLAYISNHSGETELGHFIHVIRAWELYCKTENRNIQIDKAQQVFETYLLDIANVFEELEYSLK